MGYLHGINDAIKVTLFDVINNPWPSEPYDDERDNSDGKDTNPSSTEPVVKRASAVLTSTSDPSVSTSIKSADSSDTSNFKLDSADKLGSIIVEGGADDGGAVVRDDENISEGEGLDLYNFDMLFQESVSQDQLEGGQSIRRSSRKSVLPSKLKDYVPKSFKEVVLDSKWVDAMNSEIKALNRNNASVLTDLPKGSLEDIPEINTTKIEYLC
ncbi:hypothetical protein Tco_0677737 [Tanacetum coccineum]|uniref:Uncharacterized protein n=1 Tax=Tanacetum coccineum TaxID=301880 RepID=A0ABQ4XDX4_9ASTR